MLKIENVVGLCDSHITSLECGARVSAEIEKPWSRLCLDAKRAGFDPQIASGYRDFYRQKQIWNGKAEARIPVLDANEQLLDILKLPVIERITAISHWSAIPGLSRHHWGSDFDIFDASAVPTNYRLQLTCIEAETIFAPFYGWLNEYLNEHDEFYRPYDGSGLIAEEPWHLSFRPLAQHMPRLIDESFLADLLRREQIAYSDVLLEDLGGFMRRYMGFYAV